MVVTNKFKDLTGQKFGRLLVISHGGWIKKKTFWKCLCDCGNEKLVYVSHLKSGSIKSCGCLCSELTTLKNYKHGLSDHLLYTTWLGMKSRCCNPCNKDYHSYGGRGIGVCSQWLNSFPQFVLDMGEKPKGMTLDRINTDKDYSPDNCRWATILEQGRNTRKNVNITYQNRTQCLSAWASELGLNYKMLQRRLMLGWSIERAFIEPSRRNRSTPHIQD